MKKYKYNPKFPWDIEFHCPEVWPPHIMGLKTCISRSKGKYSKCPKNCKVQKDAIKQRFEDMTTKNHVGIMFGCLTCRYCIFFHKTPRVVKNKRFECRKHKPVPVSEIDTFHCDKFLLKKFVHCPHRDETIHCNECLWDFHTQQDYCQNCEVFSCGSTSKLKLRKPQKSQIKKKPKLQLRKSKPKLKLRKKK